MDYDRLLSQKVKQIKPSGIRKFFDIVAVMKDAISLGVGEPDFVTPWHIRDAGIQSLQDGKTYYTSNWGLLELRTEAAAYLSRRYGLTYKPESEVLVTVGGSEGIDNTIRALVEPGDEVLIPEPSFVCYQPCVLLMGGVPVPIETKAEDEFKLTASQLKEKITSKTKLLILPFPNNPTGGIMEKKDLEEIAEVLRGTDILVLSDEIYAELTYGMKHTSIASIDGMWERTVVINGLSKSHAMTGWRIGFVCGPAPILEQVTKIHQYAIMSAPTVSQYAAVQALKEGDKDIEYMCGQYNMRRKLMHERFNKMGLKCFEPRGAFYVFPSIKSTGLSSEEFAERLLREEKVAVVPGNAFGESGEGHIRCCYAYSVEHIKESLDRIEHFLGKL
ncbi:MAG: aminotransferase class I/II-fold pyridoxal phosphate-dependent enzyme [Clostridia bacterium]|nr:aminotransferase class I/II-fold pyridoxal phosphate-dependent enzyme [Clostridia bacterium]